jgi:hypothetical protein
VIATETSRGKTSTPLTNYQFCADFNPNVRQASVHFLLVHHPLGIVSLDSCADEFEPIITGPVTQRVFLYRGFRSLGFLGMGSLSSLGTCSALYRVRDMSGRLAEGHRGHCFAAVVSTTSPFERTGVYTPPMANTTDDAQTGMNAITENRATPDASDISASVRQQERFGRRSCKGPSQLESQG